MKNRAMEWIVGTITCVALGLGAFVGQSFDTRITSAANKIDEVQKHQQSNEIEIKVMEEVLKQVNNRTYHMDVQLDRIESQLKKK